MGDLLIQKYSYLGLYSGMLFKTQATTDLFSISSQIDRIGQKFELTLTFILIRLGYCFEKYFPTKHF